MLETDKLTVTMTAEQAMSLRATLLAVCSNFRFYKGMNIGHSEAQNLYPSEISDYRNIADKITELLEN